eukprot:1975617-Rhodomonas_salina.2
MHDPSILLFQYYLAMLDLMAAAGFQRNWRVANHLMANAGNTSDKCARAMPLPLAGEVRACNADAARPALIWTT